MGLGSLEGSRDDIFWSWKGPTTTMNPRETLELLDRMERLGFNDEAFWRLHHRRKNGIHEKISSFRKYAKATGAFRLDGNNHLVHKRLELVLNWSEGRAPKSGRTFEGLAEDAWSEIRSLP